MIENILNNNFILNYLIWPLIIFCSRILDVSIGTIRIIMINRGIKWVAPILGFIEVFLWIVIISHLLNKLNNYLYFIAYSAGFATGNFVGMILEEKIALGYCIIRVICQKDNYKLLLLELIENGFGYTLIRAEGSKGSVNIIFTVIKRKDIKKLVELLERSTPNSFYTIEDVRLANKGIFPKK